MEKRIKNYLALIDKLLEENTDNWDFLIENHLVQISFFQHERMIHLIVTALFAVLEMLSVMLVIITGQLQVIALVVMLLVLLIPYVRHYYILENGVQKMYTQWDKMMERKKNAGSN